MIKIQKILPICAVAVGVALVMATSAFKQQPKDKNGDDMYTFEFNSELSYTEANVQKADSWIYTDETSVCDSSDVKACSIVVSGTYVDPSGTEPVLLSTLDIDTDVDPIHNTAYVTGISDTNGNYTNTDF